MVRLWICLLVLVSANVSAADQRNIIFILVDDLRFDGMGFVNNALQTPNIDRLAAGGVYLPNAVVTTSLCSPSRATILTGQSTRNHGIVDNNDTSEEGLRFFPQDLQTLGYATAFIGKWHMGRANDTPRPGFDRWVSFKGQGVYNPVPNFYLNVDGQPVAQQGYITDELNEYAMDWLADRSIDEPFFLFLSHKAVHSDATPAPRHEGQYADINIPMPDPDAHMQAPGAGKPMWVHNQRNSWHGVDFPYHSDRSIADYVKRYYATLSAVDDGIGKLLDWLETSEFANNTLVVFYSDNGFLFGDHGLIDKRNAYEASVRVPMVVYGPGIVQSGSVLTNRVRNLDLAPTFIDFASGTPDQRLEGESIKALLTGEVKASERQDPAFVYEYYWEWTFPHTPTTFAITKDEVKYIQYHGLWDLEEVYDLRSDPQEQHNLLHDPRYRNRLIDLRAALFAALTNNEGEHVVPYTQKLGQGIRFRRGSGSSTADFPDSFLREADDKDLFSGFRPPQRLKEESQTRIAP